MKRAKFEVYEDKGGGFRWRLRSRNGRIVAVGESYTRESSAKRSLRAVYTAARNAFSYEVPSAIPHSDVVDSA